MKVMIHGCIKRKDYIFEFLKPSLLNQGFKEDDIFVYLDEKMIGVRKAYIDSFKFLEDDSENVWHMQDDVLVSNKFYQMADELDTVPGIMCGYGNKEFYTDKDFGLVYTGDKMFYSFPCIRIPNYICMQFKKWVIDNEKMYEYKKYYDAGKFIDYFFKLFIGDNKKKIPIYNLSPCLVDHVDHYLGGSTIGNKRPKPSRAIKFDDNKAMVSLREYIHEKEKRRAT